MFKSFKNNTLQYLTKKINQILKKNNKKLARQFYIYYFCLSILSNLLKIQKTKTHEKFF